MTTTREDPSHEPWSPPSPQFRVDNDDHTTTTIDTNITSTTDNRKTSNQQQHQQNGSTPAKREQRGERRRKRWEATLARRAAQRADMERLRRAADTATEFTRRWDDVYAGTTRSVCGADEKMRARKNNGGSGGGKLGGHGVVDGAGLMGERERGKWKKDDDDDDDDGEGGGGGCLPYRDRHILRQLFPELMSEAVRCDPLKHVPHLHAQSQTQSQTQSNSQLLQAQSQLQSQSQSQSQEQQSFNTTTLNTINHNSNTTNNNSPQTPHDNSENPNNATDTNEKITVLEIGCGTGSTMYPLLRANPRVVGIAVDISAVAIAQLRHSAEYASAIAQRRLVTFVHDVSSTDTFVRALRQHAGQLYMKEEEEEEEEEEDEPMVDYVTCIWTLSALSPEMQRACVKTLWQCLRVNGCVLVRDFAVGDMRHVRLVGDDRCLYSGNEDQIDDDEEDLQEEEEEDGDDDKVDDEGLLMMGRRSQSSNRRSSSSGGGGGGAVEDIRKHNNQWCIRGDGTYAYFFDTDSLRSLFCAPEAAADEQRDSGGGGQTGEQEHEQETDRWLFRCEYCKYEERAVQNQKEGLVMRRRWITAKFVKQAQPQQLQ